MRCIIMSYAFLILIRWPMPPMGRGRYGAYMLSRAQACTGANSVRASSDWGKSGLLPDFFVYISGILSARRLNNRRKTKERQNALYEKN